jgi:hypothetical protein
MKPNLAIVMGGPAHEEEPDEHEGDDEGEGDDEEGKLAAMKAMIDAFRSGSAERAVKAFEMMHELDHEGRGDALPDKKEKPESEDEDEGEEDEG